SGTVHGTATVMINSTIAGRYVFYNNSAYDGGTPAADPLDDGAIDTSRSALLPGQTASSVNVTDAYNGINGVMIDVGGLPAGVDATASDFAFRVGNSSDPSTWTTAP